MTSGTDTHKRPFTFMLIYANLVSGLGKFDSQIQNSSRKLMLVLSLFQFNLGFSDEGKEKQVRLYQKIAPFIEE